MADLQKTVSIIFAGKDELSVTTRRLSGELGDFGSGIKGLSGSLSSLADMVLKVDAAFITLTAAGLFYAYSKTVSFSAATADLNKVLSDGEIPLLKSAQKEALNLSEAYGESGSAILKSMANFKQAGFDLKESMELTKASLDLVIAGDLSAAEASELLVSALKGFKAPASEAGRLVDILNEVSNNYATNVKELAAGMAELSPIAKTMGFSFEETAGILTPVIEVFRSGNESAIALKTGLLRLIDDSKPVQDALKSIGVSQKDANGQLRSGKDILLDVSKAFQGLDQNQKLFVTQQLVGIQQSARMAEVFDGLSKSSEITKVALGAAGSAAKEVAVRMAEPEVVIKKFMTGIENLSIAVGSKFKDSITGVISGGIEIEHVLKSLVDSGTFNPVFDALNRFSVQTREYLLIIAKNLPAALANIDWSGLLNSFGNLGSAISSSFKAIFGDIDLMTSSGLETFIQKIIDGFSALNNMTAGIIDGMKPLFALIGEGITQFSSISEGTADFVGNLLGMAKMFYITTTYLDPIRDIFLIFASAGMIGPHIITLVSALKTMELGMFSLNATMAASPLALAAFAVAAGVAVGALAQYIPGVKQAGESVGAWVYDLFNANDAQSALSKTTAVATTNVKDFGATVKSIPDNISTELKTLGYETALQVNKEFIKLTEQIPEKKALTVEVLADGTTIERTKNLITTTFPDGSVKIVQASVAVDVAKLAEQKKKIDSAIPDKKTIEAQVKLDEAKIKAQSDVIQKSLEWKARLDIAQVEAASKRLEYTFKSIDNTITSTGETLSSMVKSYSDALGKGGNLSFIMDQIHAENYRRNVALDMQTQLTQAEIENIKARTESMQKGEALIQIDGSGLAPHLEAFMFEILSAIQIRATAEGQNFLVGA